MKQWMPATMRWNLCVAVLALSGLGVPPSAVGQTSNSATSSQNPDLTVSVSLSAFTARVGDTVTETQSVTNNTAGDLFVTAVTTLTYPNGKTASQDRAIPAGGRRRRHPVADLHHRQVVPERRLYPDAHGE